MWCVDGTRDLGLSPPFSLYLLIYLFTYLFICLFILCVIDLLIVPAPPTVLAEWNNVTMETSIQQIFFVRALPTVTPSLLHILQTVTRNMSLIMLCQRILTSSFSRKAKESLWLHLGNASRSVEVYKVLVYLFFSLMGVFF